MLSFFNSITLLLPVFLISVNCHFKNHTVDSRLLYEVELFKRVTNEPTNYTIIFKYRADCTTGRPTFLEMNEEMMNSPAVMEFYPKSDYSNKHQHFLTDRTVDVLVNVKNTTNLMSSIRIFGSPGLSTANLIRLRLKTRSIAAICTETYMKAMKKAKITTNLIQIGIRKPDDILLRFQKVFLQTNSEYRFPRYTFDFMDPDVNITQVTITANTNKVVIFKNQILMDQQQFRATIYGFDEQHSFIAKLTIYGIKL